MRKGDTTVRNDMTGMKFGRLTVLHFSHRTGEDKTRRLHWMCACECGSETVVNGASLRSGHMG